MSEVVAAFAPKEAFREPDALGAVFISDDRDCNVRALVEQSVREDGAFLVYDQAVADALDRYQAVKRVAVFDAPAAAPEPGADPDEPVGGGDAAGEKPANRGPKGGSR